jgi:glycosyltransferase involved in cell wall biosynthesis
VRIAYLHYLAPDDSALTHVAEFTRAARELGATVDVHALNTRLIGGPSRGTPSGATFRHSLRRRLSRYLHEPNDLLRNWRYFRREARVLAPSPPDVLLVRAWLLTASFLVTARRLRLPLVLEVNAPVLESSVYKREYVHLPWLPSAVERWQLAAADAVTVVSSSLKTYLVDRHRLPPAKLAVVPNGADVMRFRPDVAPAPIRWPATATGPVVGFVGSFQEFHGIDLLARMIAQVGWERPRVRFLIVGDEARAGPMRTALAHFGDRVHFTGRVPHERVPELVNAFDVGVLPETAFYCSPLKVVEWMAAGRAVVAPRYGGLEDVMRDGVEGLLFPPRDEAALVAAVLQLIDDAARRRALGEAARRRAVESLTWRENARRVLEACRGALERRGALPAGALSAARPRHPSTE